MRDRAGLARRALAALFVAGVLTACTATPLTDAPTTSESATAFAALIDRKISDAETRGSSDAQLALLKRARSEGEVSYALAHEALENFFACLTDAGIGYEELEPPGGLTYPSIDYRVFTTDSTFIDDCATKHYDFVDSAYQLQPGIADEVESLVIAAAPDIMECLRTGGYTVAENPSYDELRNVAYLALNGVEVGQSLADAPDTHVTLDCYSPAGLEPNMVFDGPG